MIHQLIGLASRNRPAGRMVGCWRDEHKLIVYPVVVVSTVTYTTYNGVKMQHIQNCTILVYSQGYQHTQAFCSPSVKMRHTLIQACPMTLTVEQSHTSRCSCSCIANNQNNTVINQMAADSSPSSSPSDTMFPSRQETSIRFMTLLSEVCRREGAAHRLNVDR